MKKNNGFTLIELLAVIAILGILVSITTVAVNTLRKSQEEKNKENVISSILTGAKEYNAKEKIALDKKDESNSSYGTVDVDVLIKGNYVDFDTNKYTDLYSKVVTKKQCDDNKLKIQYSIKIGDKTYNDCGCEGQISNNTLSKEICEEQK